MSPHTPLRVLVLNDYDLVINGIAGMIAGGPDIVMLGTATPLGDLTADDVVIFDTFGQLDAWSRLDTILTRTAARVLIFSWSDTPDSRELFVSRGASGYLFKGATTDELVAALLAVGRGEAPLPSSRRHDEDLGAWPGQQSGLSGREAEVLALIVLGLSNEQIGARLFLSVNTVKTYIRTGYRKIGVTTRSRAVVWGVEHGFHSVGPPR